MARDDVTVVGIDVGGESKGFHAVALHDGNFVEKKTDRDPTVIVKWCLHHKASFVGVDAPCKWSYTGSSRLAERELGKQRISCFATPSRDQASNRGFYKWIFNGEKLYRLLETHYHLFDGTETNEQTCIETFPHAIVCSLAGRVMPAKPKSVVRRGALGSEGYDHTNLPNIDFIDAALCAVAADHFRKGNYACFGDYAEGFIVVPKGLD
ncbi:MAG: DUF429 domain-containing protein [Deltaproteobacteria bacterium]|nr:DUF429 domain-containing protein [Deltaproteobacteria bacterium]